MQTGRTGNRAPPCKRISPRRIERLAQGCVLCRCGRHPDTASQRTRSALAHGPLRCRLWLAPLQERDHMRLSQTVLGTRATSTLHGISCGPVTTAAIGFQGRLTLQMDAGRPMAFVTSSPVLDLTTLTIGRAFLPAPKLPARLNGKRKAQSQHRHYKTEQGSKSSHRRTRKSSKTRVYQIL